MRASKYFVMTSQGISKMAAPDPSYQNCDSVYCIVGNIPPFYHAVDLRNYFSQFLEPGGFQCFHFRHRPEAQKRREEGEIPSQSTTKDEEPTYVYIYSSGSRGGGGSGSSEKWPKKKMAAKCGGLYFMFLGPLSPKFLDPLLT